MQIFADKLFENPIKIIEAFDNEGFIEAFSQIEILRKRYYLLGYIRYESRDIFFGKEICSEYPLLYFEVFEEETENKKQETEKILQSKIVNYSTLAYDIYSKAIEQIKEEIACGNTYEVNYTYDWKIETDIDGFELYKSILPQQTTPYNAYIKNNYEEILSFSPELFFELESNKIRTKPMKGTVKRGKTKEEDEKNIKFLKNDVKNRAENVMIVDLLRNDLGKIAKTGTVKVDKLFEIETHKTLHQMTSEISAELEKNTTLFDIFEAIFPCGSITGAPKISTMEIIDKLEKGKREVYCGAIGLITPEKTIFSVPIRILQKKNNEQGFLCRIGGAIVWDSTAEEEWEETLTKIKFLGANDLNTVGRAFQPDNIRLVETMLVENGVIKYEKEHFSRMEKSAKILGFSFNKQNAKYKMQNVGWDHHPTKILRILLNKEGVFETEELSLDDIKTNIVTVSKTPINSKEILLYHKTTYRPWYEEAMQKIKNGEIFDEIFFNEKGELTEGARSNIILQINGEWFTPPIECGLLDGILRVKILQKGMASSRTRFGIYPTSYIGKMLSYADRVTRLVPRLFPLSTVQHDVENKVIEKVLYLADLQKAEKVFCINSVRGIVEVKVDFN
ncbi:MAG: aminodeoxychorismate synthase component I [Candidatus Gastranaerophilales bacterium]|nr:aminodeoxychorismate synthase component I [Candidatus Gastranaerophilales bacterium]